VCAKNLVLKTNLIACVNSDSVVLQKYLRSNKKTTTTQQQQHQQQNKTFLQTGSVIQWLPWRRLLPLRLVS